MVTFVTAYVPFIGAFVSGAFAVILALAAEGTQTAVIMLVIVLLANGLLQNVLQPVAFGATLGLNPLAVLIVTIAAGALFGMIGLILGAPLTSAAVHISRDLRAARAARSSRGASRRCRSSGRHLASAHQNHIFALAGVGPYRVGGVRGGAISPRNPQHKQAARNPTTRKVTPPFELLPSKLDSPAAAAGSRAAHRGPRSALPRE